MKVDRKKFFLTAAISLLGLSLLNKFPFSLFGRSSKKDNGKIQVKINPFAVSRKTKEGEHA